MFIMFWRKNGRKATISSLILFFVLPFSLARSTTVNVTEPKRGGNIYNYCERIPDGYILLNSSDNRSPFRNARKIGVTVLRTDNNMNVIQELPLEIQNADYISVQGMQRLQNRTYLFYTKRADKNSEQVDFCAMIINEDNLSNFDEVKITPFTAEKDKIDFSIKPAFDSSCFVLLAQPEGKKNESTSFHLVVINPDLKVNWDRNCKVNSESKFTSITGFSAFNSKKVFVNYKHFDKEVTKKSLLWDGDKIPDYSTRMVAFSEDIQQPQNLQITLPGKHIHSCDIIYDSGHKKTYLMGCYKAKQDGNLLGVYSIDFNLDNNEMSAVQLSAFPKELIGNIETDGFASTKESDPGLYGQFAKANVAFRDDGSVDYLLEYQISKSTVKNDHANPYQTGLNPVTYTYGTIVDVRFRNGTAGFVRIPKTQIQDYNKDMVSFFPVCQNNKLILFYNDNRANVDRDLSKAPKEVSGAEGIRGATLMQATLDENNNLSREIILDAKESEEWATMIDFMQKIDPKTVVFTQRHMRRYSNKTRFGKLEL